MTPYLKTDPNTSAGVAPQAPKGGQKGIIVFLSLYLLMVAFFILLNSLSVINEDKTKQVMESVQVAFRPVDASSPKAVEFISDTGALAQAAATLMQVADLVKRVIPLAKVEEVKPGQSMSISVDANSLFVAEKAQLNSSAKDLLRRAAAAINSPPVGLRYDVKAVLGRDNAASQSALGSQTLNVARAGVLVRELRARGSPKQSTLAGIDPNLDNIVELRFEVRDEKDSRITFDDYVSENEP